MKPKKLDSEAIEKWTNLGGALLGVTNTSPDPDSLMAALRKLYDAIPYIGPILTGFFDMVYNITEFKEIKEQLLEMDSHLFAIENKIDALSEKLTQTAILSYYKEQAKKINLLQTYYKRYLNAHTSIAFDELKDACKQNNILEYVSYVYKELSGCNMLPLMKVMKDNYDLANFQTWMKMLAGSLSQSMILHTICMFAKYQNSTQMSELNDTIKTDMSYFQDLSNIMIKTVKDGFIDIKQNFFAGAAKEEIRKFGTEHIAHTHKSFAVYLLARLEKKYFWRLWFVASYDQGPAGFDHHTLTADNDKFVYLKFREFNRNLIVTHTNNKYGVDSNLFQTILDNTSKILILTNDICRDIYRSINMYLPFNALGVISKTTAFHASCSEGAADFSFITINSDNLGTIGFPFYSQKDFRVFVVAPEK